MDRQVVRGYRSATAEGPPGGRPTGPLQIGGQRWGSGEASRPFPVALPEAVAAVKAEVVERYGLA